MLLLLTVNFKENRECVLLKIARFLQVGYDLWAKSQIITVEISKKYSKKVDIFISSNFIQKLKKTLPVKYRCSVKNFILNIITTKIEEPFYR